MKVKCEVCGRKFKGIHGLKVHRFHKHLKEAVIATSLTSSDGGDRRMEKVLDFIWGQFTVEQKLDTLSSFVYQQEE